jgi:hypothetical protein
MICAAPLRTFVSWSFWSIRKTFAGQPSHPCARLVEEEPGELQHRNVEVDGDDDRARDPRLQPPPGVGEQEVRQQRERNVREQQPDREGDRRVRGLQALKKPGESFRHHQPAERVLRSVRPGDQPAPDERPAEEQGDGGQHGRIVSVVARQDQRQRGESGGETDGPPRLPVGMHGRQ